MNRAMLFVIHALDKPGVLDARLARYDAHKALLADPSPYGIRIVMSGPLIADDGTTMIGSRSWSRVPTARPPSGSTRRIRSTRPASGSR